MTRPMPQNPELEQKALASVFVDSEAWQYLADLTPEVFYSEAARALYGIMTELHTAGQPLDDHSLILQRASEGPARHFLTLAYLVGVVSMETTAYYAEHYARELRALHGRREAIRLAHQVVHHATEGDLSGDELAALASRVGLPLEGRAKHGFTSHAQAIDEALTDMNSETPNAISTGFPDLDRAILGFEPGAMYVLAARPAMGKSALGYHFVMSAAKAGYPAAVGSLEMRGKALTTRALATAASVDLNRIRQRTLTAMERGRLNDAAARLRDLPITFMEATDQTGASLARDARKLKADGKLDLLMIDYLQLIESGKPGGSENRVQEVSAISRLLKKLAMELEVPVVVLSQLSRAVEMRPSHKPMLSDLRESGAVEQDADTVMFIYRDEYYNDKTDKQGVAEIIIGKQRSGPVGSVELSYSSEFVRFGNLTRYSDRVLT